MNRNFIFAFIFILLVTHVKGETQFKNCVEYPDAELLGVKLTPDPIAPGEQTFEVSITLQNYTITPATVLYINVIDQVNPKILAFYTMDLCSQSDCPIKVGTKYSTTQKFTLPAKIPSKYFIEVEHFLVEPDVKAPFSCAIAIIGS